MYSKKPNFVPKALHAALVACAFGTLPSMTWAQAQNTSMETIEIVANGKGSSRQVESISAGELNQILPGGSPMLAVSRLPSVNFQSADTFGSYEWSERITVRGFNQNQLGFTLDDVPLGDMSYGNLNGLHISRAIATENISRTTLSAGAGSLSTASSSNLGGTLQFYSKDPSKDRGASFNVGAGSFSTGHLFGRYETGQTDAGRAFVSLTSQTSNKWKGTGADRQVMFNSKYVNEFDGNKLTAFFNLSDRREVDYQDLSLAMINQYGQGIDNTFPNFGQALNIANTVCGNTVNGKSTTYTPACDYQYYAGSGLRKDQIYGMSLKSSVSDNLSTKATIYHHNNNGVGTWYTPYVASPNGSPISERTTEYAINRSGLLGEATYTAGIHAVKAAFWYEDNLFNNARRYYSVTPTAPSSPYDFPTNPFYTQWQYQFDTKTTMVSIEDSVTLSPNLTFNFGAKSLNSSITGNLQVGDPSSKPQGTISASKPFLPQIGLTYTLDRTSELFAGVAQNMRAYQAAGVSGPFSTSTAGFNAIQSTLKPEISTTYEGGWRFNNDTHQVLVALYDIEFKDRWLGIQVGPGIVGNPSVLANVGGVSMKGIEVSDSWKMGSGYSWYNGVSMNKSTYNSNYTSNGVVYNTDGKTMVDTPSTLFKSILSYDTSEYFGNLSLDYMSKRYYTYSNDASVPSRSILNGVVGYKMGQTAGMSDAVLQLSIANITDQKYISTIGSNGFSYSDAQGTSQTILPGAPRAFFLSLNGKL